MGDDVLLLRAYEGDRSVLAPHDQVDDFPRRQPADLVQVRRFDNDQGVGGGFQGGVNPVPYLCQQGVGDSYAEFRCPVPWRGRN